LVVGPLLERVTPQPRPEAVAAAAGGEQVVSVRVTIEGDGHVSYVDPVSGPMMLMPSVMEAVREWKFGASTLGKDAIQTEADLTIKFRPKR
jgi:outer membrane biosynthesis protein TonB